MLITCSVCGTSKEDTSFNRVKGKCNTCCYSQEYNKIKEKMGHPESGEIVYLKKVILNKAKKRSKKKNLEFDITLGDLISIKNILFYFFQKVSGVASLIAYLGSKIINCNVDSSDLSLTRGKKYLHEVWSIQGTDQCIGIFYKRKPYGNHWAQWGWKEYLF